MSANNSSKKRTINKSKWSNGGESILLDLWEDNVADLRGTGKNSQTYKRMADSLKSYGFIVSRSDVKFKISNMSRKYRLEKEKLGPSSWEHFNRVHNILDSYKSFNMDEVMVERTGNNYSEACLVDITDDDCSSSFDSAMAMGAAFETDTPPRKRKCTRDEEDREFKRGLLELGTKRNALLSELVEANKNMEETFSNYVNRLNSQLRSEKDCMKRWTTNSTGSSASVKKRMEGTNIVNRPTTSHVSDQNSNEVIVINLENVDTSTDVDDEDLSSTFSGRTLKKAKKSGDSSSATMVELLSKDRNMRHKDKMNSLHTVATKEKISPKMDGVAHFLQSIGETIKNFPPKKLCEVKLKIMNLVSEMEMQVHEETEQILG